VLEDRVDFPELETLEFVTAQLVAVAGGTVTLETFSFKIGYLVNLGNGWVVQKSDGQAQRYIEPIDERTKLEMVAIRGGSFMMGAPTQESGHYDDESPQHLVTVPDFYMARYPVTQAQWRAVAALPQVEIELDPDPSHFKGDTRPVEQVTWYEAVEFCARLAKQTGRPYRLPTEAEWEYACRAGTTTPFYFGSTLSPDLANSDGNYTYGDGSKGKYRRETTPVEHFEVANGWGLSDMHGNVWEWCQDHWHSSYAKKPEHLKQNGNEAWVEKGINDNDNHYRLCRGGSWFYNPRYCRSAYRYASYPRDQDNDLGFRVSCSAPGLL
jgi:formylglycine-generating enzyme required for sulfatase activity